MVGDQEPTAAVPPDTDSLEAAARLFEEAAAELDRASAHCRRTAEQFRGREVPRAAAHAWVALGHLREAERAMEAQAREHRLRANV
jgi:hypothetical protein